MFRGGGRWGELKGKKKEKESKGEKMENGRVEEDGICSSETANGGEDVYSCKISDASSADHLVIMVHGILGR